MAARRKIEFLLTAKDKMAAGFRSAQTKLEKFRKSASGLASSLGIVFAGGGIIAGIKRMATEMDGLAKTARKLGTTTEELSKLRYAAELTGVAANTLDQALQRMVRRVAEAAQGTGEAKSALEELGLKAQDLAKLSMDEQFKTIADAMGDITSQSDKVRLAFKLFDSGGVAIINTMEGGRVALDKYGKELEEFGKVVTTEASKASEELNDNLTRLQARTDGLAQSIGNHLIPNWNEWIDLASGTPVELLGDTELVSKELQKVALALVNVKAQLAEMRQYKADNILSAAELQGVNRRIETLEAILEGHEKRKADIIRGSAVPNEKKKEEQAERKHNREMAAVRKAEEEALKDAHKAKEAEYKRHEKELQASKDRQVDLLQTIKDAIDEFSDHGTEPEVPDRADTVTAVAAVWDNINAGDTAGAKAALEALIEMFRAYQEAGKASAADVITLTSQLEALAKATNELDGKGLEERTSKSKAEAEAIKAEIEGKPIKAPVEATEDSGKKIWIGAQNQVQAEGPIKVAVELGLAWGATVPGVATQGDVQQQDVQSESLKRGYRI